MDKFEEAVARYTAIGMAADEGKTVLLASHDGHPQYLMDEDGEMLPLFSGREDAKESGSREFLLMPLAEAFRFQMKTGRGQGIILDPFTDPIWIIQKMIPILLAAGRHKL